MPIQDPIILDIDIKNKNYVNEPLVTSNDSNVFIINITDDGIPLDIANVTTVSLAHTRPDRQVFVTDGLVTGTNQVTFKLGTSETAVAGRVDAVVQLYSIDGRVSTLSFSYKVERDPTGAGYQPSEVEQTLIQVVLNDGPLRIQEAIDATIAANDATTNANTEASNLSQLKIDVTTATTAANTATESANTATTNANTATENANTQATFAQNQGDYAKAEADRLVGTDVSVLDNKIGVMPNLQTIEKGNLVGAVNEVTAQLAEKAKQSDLVSTNNTVALKADKTEVSALASGKADKTYVDTNLATVNSRVTGIDRGYGGTYATLSALQTAFPTGNTNRYVVSADGNWYYWNGTAWTSGGVFQASGTSPSVIKNKTFPSADSRFEEVEKDTYFPAKNLLVNGNIATVNGWAGYQSTISANENVLTATGNGGNYRVGVLKNTLTPIVPSKMYLRTHFKTSDNSVLSTRLQVLNNVGDILLGEKFITAPTPDVWHSLSMVHQFVANDIGFYIAARNHYADAATANGKKVDFKYFTAIDLTATFGTGNEPTVEEMDALMNRFPNSWFDGTVQFENVKSLMIRTMKEIRNLATAIAEDAPVEVVIPEQQARDTFIVEMNNKAKEIGMVNSKFVDPAGVVENIATQYSTAEDLVRMGIYATGYDELMKIWQKVNYTVPVKGINPRNVPIVSSVIKAPLDDHYKVLGGKTGTATNNLNIVSIVQSQDKKQWLVGSVMGTATDRHIASKELYDIATKTLKGETTTGLDIQSQYGAVALVPPHNPFAYGRVGIDFLWTKSPNIKTMNASTTKVMSVLVALDYLDNLDEKVTVLASDIAVGFGSDIFPVGDVMTLRDAIHCMMLPSNNTMSNVIARVAGEKIIRSRQ